MNDLKAFLYTNELNIKNIFSGSVLTENGEGEANTYYFSVELNLHR